MLVLGTTVWVRSKLWEVSMETLEAAQCPVCSELVEVPTTPGWASRWSVPNAARCCGWSRCIRSSFTTPSTPTTSPCPTS